MKAFRNRSRSPGGDNPHPTLKLTPINPMRPSGTKSDSSASHTAAASIRSVTRGVMSNRDNSANSGVTTWTLDSASVRARCVGRGWSMPAGCKPDMSSTV